ncbi:hypothetical protein OPT61_g2011 [Boeremia exigua]|uniref:Uncharacterized protein n=1 Tax=Boeremia exigua TaxID=749465 RepID=A0ACC2INI5_9PLEO|nr:hypothetical protein OPT61_g2011 [Boeremia exigua]
MPARIKNLDSEYQHTFYHGYNKSMSDTMANSDTKKQIRMALPSTAATAMTMLKADGTPEQWDRMGWKVITLPELQDVEPERICEHFNKWLASGEEDVNPNSYRYRACLYVDEGCISCHDHFMQDKSLDTENPLVLVDTQGFTFAYLVSKFAKEGWVMVSTGVIMPRAGQTIMHEGEHRGWAEIYREEGTFAVDF